jgi:cyclophilin family peptidyl-prolyl cis-trans isomerase
MRDWLTSWQDDGAGQDRGSGGGAGLEWLEPRLMLAATVTSALADLAVNKNHSAITIDVASHFDDPALVGTVVRFNTVMGVIPILLYDVATDGRTAAPLTVANFLHYVNGDPGYGSYDNSIVHRSDPGNVALSLPVDERGAFVIQGGGFRYNNGLWGYVNPSSTPATVQNEYSSTRPNVRGTIAMALVGSNINSATDQWFINLGDNTASLDPQYFTTFGQIIGNGMDVVDAISALPIYTATGIYSAFNQLPLRDLTGNTITPDNPVIINSVTVGKLTYTVTTDTPSLLTASMDGGSLILNPVAAKTGVGHVTVTATDINGTSVSDTFLVTVGASGSVPKIGGLTGSPTSVLRNSQLLSLSTWGVSGSTSAAVNRVEFYRDVNGNGILEPGLDVLLGKDTSSSGGWTLSVDTKNLALGANKIFARAVDVNGNGSAPVSLNTTVVNKAPTMTSLGSLTATERLDTWSITYEALKARSNVADANNDTIQFRIEQVLAGTLKKNGTAVTAGTTLLGPGETLTWTPPDATAYVYNAFTIKAWDGLVASTTALTVKLMIDRAPTVSALTFSPTLITMPGGPVKLTATASDPDDSVAKVEFFYDTNNNGVFDAASDALLGIGTLTNGKWVLYLSGSGTAAFRSGPAVIFARATDTWGLTGLGKFTATVNAPPTVTALLATDPVQRGNKITLTATGVQDPDGTVSKVVFYVDSNGNGQLDSSDKSLGNGTLVAGTTNYVLSVSTAGFPSGSVKFFARATDNKGGTGTAVATTTIQNIAPTLKSLTRSVATVARGSKINLTASGAADKDGKVTKVEFFMQAGTGAFDTATAIKIGEVANSWGTVSLNFTVPLFATVGPARFFARAVDNNGLGSALLGVSATITNILPKIAGFTVSPTTVTQPANITLTATGVTDPDGFQQVQWVRFYEDTNKNGVFDAGDRLLGEDTSATGGYTITIPSSNLSLTGSVRLLAIAQDYDGGTSAVKSATITVRPPTA